MTILGQHTAAETLDLVKDKDNLLSGLATSFASLPAPAVTDTGWYDDFTALQSRYDNAKTVFDLTLTMNPLVSNNLLTTESDYQAILSALQKTSGVTSSGDAQDVYNRLSAMLAAYGAPPVNENVVQPTAPDADLAALQAATQVTTAINNAAAAAAKGATSAFSSGKLITYGVVGVVGLLGITFVAAKLS